ncbi:tetraspanin-9-like [Sitodiplosis mosellana]|uniref:tetraspanin-9-like n=1 Tax=Sitodiplosis mosellana TaxID=263140 RepID=UPI002443BEB5|nr:tetraspanin-9-like [Sitodiplosis mosellana]XP_055296827.1 tetraspanin-9-like [Sitodiplosis mosellana]XP_055296828.1 tetraspanin-9-like [Sitodiplosis mosellana]
MFGLKCIKNSLFVVNFLFFLFGLGLTIVGVLIYYNVDFYVEIIPEHVSAFPIGLIVIGCIIFVTAFLGCCGACTENSIFLLAFSIVLAIMFMVEVGLLIAASIKKDGLEVTVQDSLERMLNEYNENQNYQASWHFLQTEFKCCGINSATDWQSITGDELVPPSCCQKAQNETCRKENASKTGCQTVLLEYLRNIYTIFTLIAVIIWLIQFIGIIFACCLYQHIGI